jgi:hypothetical protein
MVFSAQHFLPVIGATTMGVVTDTGERMMIIVSEQPERMPGFTGELTKETLERYHLERFRIDVLLRSGSVPFEGVERGPDPSKPPDFLVHTPDGATSLDLVALARSDRRNSYRLFEHLQSRLQAGVGNRDFTGVAGCILSVWFGPHLDDLPPKRTDDEIVDELLDLIAASRVDHQGHAKMMESVAQHGFPEHYPPIMATGKTAGEKAGFVANIALPPERAGELPGGLGFQLQLHAPMPVTKAMAMTELSRIVEQHDQPHIEHLVVTAGGPDRNGIRYPTEELIAALLFEEEPPAVKAAHLKRVTVHLWSRRETIDVAVYPPPAA